MAAAFNSEPEVTELLLNHGGDIHDGDTRDWTPLHHAAASNVTEVVASLLDRGADIHAGNNYGATPLHLAATYNAEPAVVALLLDRGADIHGRDDHDKTPVVAAAFHNKEAGIMELLLDRGADIQFDGGKGLTLLHYASFNGSPEVMELLLDRGLDVSARGDEGETPLFNAVVGGEPAAVELLLDRGADIHARDSYYGWTPLHTSVSFVSFGRFRGTGPALVGLLLDRGADIEARDDDGNTPLHLAVAISSSDAELLELKDQLGGEPGDELEVVELLLDRGADIEARGDNRETPLHVAAYRNEEPAMVKLLLDRGAGIHALNGHGKTPCQLAGDRGFLNDTGVYPRLCAEFGHWHTEDFWRNASATDVRRELERGADIHALGGYGATPLHNAVSWNDDLAVAALLLDMGADIEAKAKIDGRRPLHYAAGMGKSEFAALLLDRGVDIEAPDDEGGTPLHVAAEYLADAARLAVITLLLDRGANIEAQNIGGATPLHHALFAFDDNGYPAAAALLLWNVQPPAGVGASLVPVEPAVPSHSWALSLSTLADPSGRHVRL